MDHVAGYVVVNDVSARDWQGSPRRCARARRATASGCAPRAATRSCRSGRCSSRRTRWTGAPASRLRSWRIPGSGQRRRADLDAGRQHVGHAVQRARSSISFISQQITLEPGDLIVTGTPAGVGVFRDPPVFLEPGDRVRCEIEGIGAVENPIVDWTDDPRADD